jgi:hypothetical protein
MALHSGLVRYQTCVLDTSLVSIESISHTEKVSQGEDENLGTDGNLGTQPAPLSKNKLPTGKHLI